MPLEESVENAEKKQKKWTGSQTREFSGTGPAKIAQLVIFHGCSYSHWILLNLSDI
jgi:hypothetical protein